MNNINLSWIIDGKLAGHQAPLSEHDLAWLKKHGIIALVRMVEEHKHEVDKLHIEQMGLWDCHEPVLDFTAPNGEQGWAERGRFWLVILSARAMTLVPLLTKSVQRGRDPSKPKPKKKL